jgi:peptidoglycan/LPS O-acetylase OafA/YrhL
VRAEDYFWGLDLIRLGAALLVAFFHLTWMRGSLHPAITSGWIGVEIFFVLSGIVIAQSAQGRRAADFAVGRFLRLYPTAWICTLLCVAALLLAGSLGHYPWVSTRPLAILNSLTLFAGTSWVASAYWTMPVELAFYALVFLLLLAGRGNRLTALAGCLAVWSLLWNACLLASLAGALPGVQLPGGDTFFNMLLLQHGCFFSLGILLFRSQHQKLSRGLLLIVVLDLLAALCEIVSRANEIAGAAWVHESGLQLSIWGCGLWFAAMGAMLAALRFNRYFPANKRLRSMVRAGGLMTYPVYLLHESVGSVLDGALEALGGRERVAVPLAVLGCCLLALVVSRYVEPLLRRPLRALANRLAGAPPRGSS